MKELPEEWTGHLIGRMHNERIIYEDLAAELGCTKQYVSMILDGREKPKNARERLEAAFDSALKKKQNGVLHMNDVQSRDMFRRVLNQKIQKTGIKLVTLARLVGVSQSQVVRWTQGDLMPDWRQFNRVLEVFGIEGYDILGNSVSEHAYNKRFK